MSNQTFSEKLKTKRNKYGISQNKLAVIAGVPCYYLSDVETGKIIPSKEKKKLLTDGLEKLNPDSPLTLMFDYGESVFQHWISDTLSKKSCKSS